MSSQNRPAPRRSSLAGSSPVTPPPEDTRTAQQSEAGNSAKHPGQSGSQTTAQITPQKAKPKYRPKVSFYQDPADTARVRGAILHTMAAEGPRSLSQFIDAAVMLEVERLEVKYNDGRPFSSVRARELPQGRPMGE